MDARPNELDIPFMSVAEVWTLAFKCYDDPEYVRNLARIKPRLIDYAYANYSWEGVRDFHGFRFRSAAWTFCANLQLPMRRLALDSKLLGFCGDIEGPMAKAQFRLAPRKKEVPYDNVRG
jgi:hypothetical protein